MPNDFQQNTSLVFYDYIRKIVFPQSRGEAVLGLAVMWVVVLIGLFVLTNILYYGRTIDRYNEFGILIGPPEWSFEQEWVLLTYPILFVEIALTILLALTFFFRVLPRLISYLYALAWVITIVGLTIVNYIAFQAYF